MTKKMGYYVRWVLLMAGGAILLQAPTCWDIAQTGLLAFIGGTTYFLARNI